MAVVKIDTSIKAETEIYLNKKYWYPDEILFIISDVDDKEPIQVVPSDIGSGRYTFRLDNHKFNGKRIKIEVYLKAGYA